MEFKLKTYNRNISDEEMIEDMKSTAKLLNKSTISISEYNNLGKFNHKTICKRFGSWNDALKNANLDLTLELNLSEETLFQNLRDVWIKLEKQPTRRNMRKPLSLYSESAYCRKYGSWMEALEKFVEYVNQPENSEQQEKEKELIVEEQIQTYKKHKTKRDPNWRLRFLVLKRDNFACVMCGRSPAKNPEIELHVDHIKPWSKGGETVFENLQTLCSVCNIGKSNLE